MTRAGTVSTRAERTRTAILEAAETLFAARGFAGTRLADVAEQVGIRRASIVYYFRSKRELYHAILEVALADLLRRCERALHSPGPLVQRLERLVSTWVDYAVERPSVVYLVARELPEEDKAATPVMLSAVMPVLQDLGRVIEEGQRRGLLRGCDPADFLTTIGGATVFYLLTKPGLGPDWKPTPRDPKVEQHRAHVLRMARAMLGIRSPRLVRTADQGKGYIYADRTRG